ncbi:GntR family transcriptional regulator [Nisaea acidiphila]|uniref:GntR family transcriptional regulator n=1 Tax=Nisaea acidiphila TaxID=1862145 RepID=A0A9J7APJ5_9PROT|nr:GntR family transcriptional regulator [Nisaea acidiphila]UUX48268.1 GntR family transcriptional regulator [Nisaea acidiphila]
MAVTRVGDVKLYGLVCDGLRRQIRSGMLKRGDRLPSLEQLAVDFGVSLITVRKAVEILEDERLLERQQGRGTFVADTGNAREWLRLSTTWSDLMQGYADTRGTMENEVLLLREDQHPVFRDRSAGDLAENYVFMRRRHFVEGLAYAYTDLYLDQDLYRRAPEAFRNDMVLRVLGGLDGFEIGEATQSVTIGSAGPETADILNLIVGAPVGELLREVIGVDGRLVYHGEVVYRGDLVRIDTRLI